MVAVGAAGVYVCEVAIILVGKAVIHCDSIATKSSTVPDPSNLLLAMALFFSDPTRLPDCALAPPGVEGGLTLGVFPVDCTFGLVVF